MVTVRFDGGGRGGGGGGAGGGDASDEFHETAPMAPAPRRALVARQEQHGPPPPPRLDEAPGEEGRPRRTAAITIRRRVNGRIRADEDEEGADGNAQRS